MKRLLFLVAVVLYLAALGANAAVSVNGLFTNNMVLQRGKPVPVWGTASANKNIIVNYNGQEKTTTSDIQGRWLLYLDAMAAKSTGSDLTIEEVGGNKITITNTVVGDVWLCSGQSNMLMSLGGCNRQVDIDSASFPGIRAIWAPWGPSREPVSGFTGNWNICSPSTAGGFSATAFYFARKIYLDNGRNVPIGLLQTTVGGTRIDPWLAPEGCTNIPVLQPLLNQEVQSSWSSTFAIFNGMVHPFAPYSAKGLIWYQGENSENSAQSADSYYLKLKALQQGWGSLFGPGDFAFYVVQIANYGDLPTSATPVLSTGGWDADTRLQQANALALPHAGMASAIDIGESGDMHPKDKLDLGERLALWALKNEYGQTNIVTSGPILRDVSVVGSTVVCSFDYVGSGLMVGSKTYYQPTQEVVGGTLQRFSIAGTDGKWYAANAVISGDTVVLSSPSVATPKKVSYACWGNPLGCNLYNREGLPASPFHVDDVAAKYTVTASAGAGGSISPNGATVYLKRKTALYTITPDDGYYIEDVKVDGVSVGSVKTYTFDPLYANHTISVTFAETAPNYTVNASCNAGGSIIPSGAVSVAQGGAQLFRIVPNSGYRLISTTIDGARVGARYSANFGDVRTNHAVSAFFAQIPAPGTGTGLRGDYYEGTNFGTFRLSRTDANINFGWGAGSPDPIIPANKFSVRWTGQIEPQFTETYNFYITGDDGAKVWVNNQLVGAGGINLTAGQKVPIKIEYWDDAGDASCVLEWYSPSLPREIVPKTQLYPVTTPIYALTASSGANGTVSPAGTVLANPAGSQVFSITPSTGYRIEDVKVDNVSVGAVTSYTFNSIAANHTISATFAALASYPVSGKVTNKTTGEAISGATVGFYFTGVNATGNAAYTATTDGSGNYTVNVPMGTWYARAMSAGYFTSAAQALTVASGPVTGINLTLADGTRNIPRTGDLLFSCVTDSLPASGSTGNWPTYLPAGQTLTKSGNQVVEMVDGVKWEKNTYSGDVFKQGSYTAPIPCNGVTIVAAVRPVYVDPGGEPRGEIVDIFHYRLGLAISHSDGKLMACRNHWADWGPSIPNGQKTILSMVVQPNGSYKVFANGTQVMSGGAEGDFTSLAPNAESYAKSITIGRNDADWWSTYNGNIGDVFVYKTALSDADRQTLESDLTNKFVTGGANTYAITASAGVGGTISPSGTVNVNPGASQSYSIAPDPGYRILDVTVDGVSKGAISAFTFAGVNATHSIAVTFVPAVTHTITASAGAGGSISPSGTVSAYHGVDQAFTITPSVGYAVDTVTVDGVNKGAIFTYTFPSVSADHSISATFKAMPSLTITASAGTGGSISPSGDVSVAYGADQTFTITPSNGYAIEKLTVDGVVQASAASYKFTKVETGHTISVTFYRNAKLTGTIIGTPGSWDGTSTKEMAFDGNVNTFFDAPNPGTNAWVGLDLGSPVIINKVRYYPRSTFASRMNGGKFQGSNTADFSSGVVDLYTIPTTPPVAWSEQAITNTNAFRYVRYLSVGTTYGNVAEVEFYGYAASCTITASAGANGSISPSGAVSVDSGASKTFTITPSAGYGIAGLMVDNAPVTPAASYTFTNVTADHSISATFGKVYGMNNKSALTDAKASGRIVKVWGKIGGYTAGSTSFTLSDGYRAAVTIRVSGAALPSGFGNGKTAVVTGILGADKSVQAQDIKTP